ncbi:hypothetical protein ROTAS13_01423 [Roseomonas sp. TAS13]|nr:hypothetical protein ROTAS13_01423 [Roseomonas sp. TAS13]
MDILRPGQGRGLVGPGQQQDEFLPAIARGHLAGKPDGQAQRLADGAQAIVAGLVAIGVVEGLEVIDIDHQQRHPVVLPHRPRQGLVEAAPVGEAGQPVGQGEAPQRLQRLPLRALPGHRQEQEGEADRVQQGLGDQDHADVRGKQPASFRGQHQRGGAGEMKHGVQGEEQGGDASGIPRLVAPAAEFQRGGDGIGGANREDRRGVPGSRQPGPLQPIPDRPRPEQPRGGPEQDQAGAGLPAGEAPRRRPGQGRRQQDRRPAPGTAAIMRHRRQGKAGRSQDQGDPPEGERAGIPAAATRQQEDQPGKGDHQSRRHEQRRGMQGRKDHGRP